MRLLKLIDKWVYSHSKKPKRYKRVKKPPRSWVDKIISPQDARQQQYNKWCKRYGIYSGSYLPDNPDKLLKKGWREFTSPKDKTGLHREFQRKSTGRSCVTQARKMCGAELRTSIITGIMPVVLRNGEN